MKALFLATQTMSPTQGICRKILAQCEGFRANGVDTDFCCLKEIDGKFYYVINDSPISCVGSGKLSNILLRCKFNAIFRYIKENKINFIYIRYVHVATPFFIRFLKNLKANGIKVYMEMPTFPYDDEYKNSKKRVKLLLKIENIYRKHFPECVDKIVTVQDYDHIFNIPTIKISNGVNLNDICLRTPIQHQGYNLLGVANLEMWHGYDRLIEGIGRYYRDGGKEEIHFYIVGKKDSVETEYIEIAKNYNIEDRIHLEGPKQGKDLDEYFNYADLAIGTLGVHRKRITDAKPLKCVEYASRGIPFIYSENNFDFDKSPFIKKVPQNDDAIDVEELLNFLDSMKITPKSIREYVENGYSWKDQMNKIIKAL